MMDYLLKSGGHQAALEPSRNAANVNKKVQHVHAPQPIGGIPKPTPSAPCVASPNMSPSIPNPLDLLHASPHLMNPAALAAMTQHYANLQAAFMATQMQQHPHAAAQFPFPHPFAFAAAAGIPNFANIRMPSSSALDMHHSAIERLLKAAESVATSSADSEAARV